MKAISVRQPYAWAIAAGWKPVENRKWNVDYRGPLAIHAAKRWDREALPEVLRLACHCGVVSKAELAPDRPEWATGAVIAVVDLVDICTAASRGGVCQCGPWALPDQAHWRLARPRRLAQPIEIVGRLGLWNLDLVEEALT